MRSSSVGTLMLLLAMIAAGTWAVFWVTEPGSLVQLLTQNYLCASATIRADGRVA